MKFRPIRAVRRLSCRVQCGDWPLNRQEIWIVRKLDKNIGEWVKGKGIPEVLAKTAFEQSEEVGVSVYEVNSDIQEACVISAIVLNGTSLPDTVAVLRMSRRELERAGVRFKSSEGVTGIPWVDMHHFDLHAPLKVYSEITRTMLDDQISGRDQVRKLHTNQVVFQWRSLHSQSGKLPIRVQAHLNKRLEQAKRKEVDAQPSSAPPSTNQAP